MGQCLHSLDDLEEAGSSREQTMLWVSFGDRNLEKCQAKLVSLGHGRYLGDSRGTDSEQGQLQLQSRASYTLGQSQVVGFNLYRALFQQQFQNVRAKHSEVLFHPEQPQLHQPGFLLLYPNRRLAARPFGACQELGKGCPVSYLHAACELADVNAQLPFISVKTEPS